ncbi:MAG TPA: hybrid sensor histidine kinase/response regulator [Polyangiaceae bacterium]|nr:hybrid sensor histidine kinase/response regulator [Polyangiaceae bacterium]
MSPSRVTFEALSFADELEVDPSLLRRLLVSLIEHALRRAPEGTKVILVVSPRPDCTEFRVADEGAPLPLDTRKRVFAPPAVGQHEHGLALTSCRLVAEAEGGCLWIADTATGAVVCLALPTAASSSHRGPARSQSGTQLRAGCGGPETAGRSILVVDDEPLIRTFVSRALKDEGYEVSEADCAELAMDRLMAGPPPAALLSDVGLPGASGADLVRQAKLLNPRLATLLMSATPKHALVREGVIKAETELLQKPFAIADLFARIDKLFSTRRAVG